MMMSVHFSYQTPIKCGSGTYCMFLLHRYICTQIMRSLVPSNQWPLKKRISALNSTVTRKNNIKVKLTRSPQSLALIPLDIISIMSGKVFRICLSLLCKRLRASNMFDIATLRLPQSFMFQLCERIAFIHTGHGVFFGSVCLIPALEFLPLRSCNGFHATAHNIDLYV